MKPLRFQICRKKGLADSEFKFQPHGKYPSDEEKFRLGSVILELYSLGIECGIVLSPDEIKSYVERGVRDIIKRLSPHEDWDKCFND